MRMWRNPVTGKMDLVLRSLSELTVKDHDLLDGLTDDDHTQYLLTDGTRAMTGALQLQNGTSINEFSTDGTLAGNSDDAIPTEKAVKTYVDSAAWSYVKVSDVKPSGTEGGTFTQGAWQTRTINTEDSDSDGICSISSNQITLDAGTYICKITAPAFKVGQHKLRLQNVTGASTLLIGSNEFSGSGGWYCVTTAQLCGKFTVAASQALEVQHRCTATLATSGFGNAANFGVSEVYAVAEFWKVG